MVLAIVGQLVALSDKVVEIHHFGHAWPVGRALPK